MYLLNRFFFSMYMMPETGLPLMMISSIHWPDSNSYPYKLKPNLLITHNATIASQLSKHIYITQQRKMKFIYPRTFRQFLTFTFYRAHGTISFTVPVFRLNYGCKNNSLISILTDSLIIMARCLTNSQRFRLFNVPVIW